MITIVTAPPKIGKTLYMACVSNEIAFDRNRYKKMFYEVMQKVSNGFKFLKTIPQTCVSANFDLTFKKFGYSFRKNRRINPYRLGFKNTQVKTHFNLPYEAIFITEGQKYFNSRMSLYYPDWQSRWFEQHGHDGIDIWIDTQRPGLIDTNIRSLSKFIEIRSFKECYNQIGQVVSITFITRHFDNDGLWDKYLSSGKTDSSCYEEKKEIFKCNAFALYDYKSSKPLFYDGHFESDFDIKISNKTDGSLESYIKILLEFDDELPANFYIKKRGA